MGGCCVAEKVGAIDRAEDWKFRRLAEAIRVLVFKLLVELRAARGREWRNILQDWSEVGLKHMRKEYSRTCRSLKLRGQYREVLTVKLSLS
jgi:hypothetical protein